MALFFFICWVDSIVMLRQRKAQTDEEFSRETLFRTIQSFRYVLSIFFIFFFDGCWDCSLLPNYTPTANLQRQKCHQTRSASSRMCWTVYIYFDISSLSKRTGTDWRSNSLWLIDLEGRGGTRRKLLADALSFPASAAEWTTNHGWCQIPVSYLF